MMGDIILHGPHHAAQKSTTSKEYFDFSRSKFESVRFTGLLIFFSSFINFNFSSNISIFLFIIAEISSSSGVTDIGIFLVCSIFNLSDTVYLYLFYFIFKIALLTISNYRALFI